jgi:3',5'-cyclic AMP phosphodiesterase CpdA
VAFDRRKFLKTAALAGVAAAFAGAARLAWGAVSAAPVEAPGSFDFAFFTDAHIEPELNAGMGCDKCFRKIASLKPDFAINGGDHVYDSLGVGSRRATSLFDLYEKTEQSLQMPLYHAIGNHDVFGILAQSGVSPSDPEYAKKMYEDRVSRRTYLSFDHKGYHFIILDSIQPTADRLWTSRIDDPQLQWLANDLRQAGPTQPIVVIVHVPMVTGFGTYAPKAGVAVKHNAYTVDNTVDVLPLFAGHNVLAVLQGHTHVNELVNYKNIQFITSGAVSGNWWHGPRMGFLEGFTVVSLRDGALTTRYETYGFHSVDIRERY